MGLPLLRQFQLRVVLTIMLAVLAAGCATPERLPPVPVDEATLVQPLGIPNARFFPDSQTAELTAEANAALDRQKKYLGITDPDAPLPPANFLAISGGSDEGAFGAGLLNGWTVAGTRPQFDLVTGVSTGALSAPFAFLGSDHDDDLREVYTTIGAADIFTRRGFISGLFSDALTDTTPLWRLIVRYVDADLMAEIAREYEKGRLLIIGTTNLDAERAVLWNIGAIAASGHPGALNLIRNVLRASSAIPGAFPPVMIDVELNGVTYQEMHVDGATSNQLFLYPPSVRLQQVERRRSAYLIRNARMDPEWTKVERRALTIASRAISAMIHANGTSDLTQVYFVTLRDGVDYNLAYIGREFDAPRGDMFDPVYMRALYDYAFELAKAGYPWRKAPPTLQKPPAP
jgi:hypothetical protein